MSARRKVLDEVLAERVQTRRRVGDHASLGTSYEPRLSGRCSRSRRAGARAQLIGSCALRGVRRARGPSAVGSIAGDRARRPLATCSSPGAHCARPARGLDDAIWLDGRQRACQPARERRRRRWRCWCAMQLRDRSCASCREAGSSWPASRTSRRCTRRSVIGRRAARDRKGGTRRDRRGDRRSRRGRGRRLGCTGSPHVREARQSLRAVARRPARTRRHRTRRRGRQRASRRPRCWSSWPSARLARTSSTLQKQLRSSGYCARPVRLKGHVETCGEDGRWRSVWSTAHRAGRRAAQGVREPPRGDLPGVRRALPPGRLPPDRGRAARRQGRARTP